MLKRLFISFALLGVFLSPVYAELQFPEATGVVNDFANILSNSTEDQIRTLIESVKRDNGAEIAIVTIQSLEGYEISDYAVQMGRAWGIGNEEKDDGVLFLTSVDDRKTFIATGYGVEAYITDIQAHWITENDVVPLFKKGNYNAGILVGTKRIADALLELEALPKVDKQLDLESKVQMILYAVFFIFFIVGPWLFGVLGRSKRWWPGGVAGGVLGTIAWYFFISSWVVILVLALFGFFIDYISSKNYKKGKDSWWTGGGSSGWGGGGGFGGGSSGGFGGFGGGSFGGGGGGSSW